jgi:hypothetical protein
MTRNTRGGLQNREKIGFISLKLIEIEPSKNHPPHPWCARCCCPSPRRSTAVPASPSPSPSAPGRYRPNMPAPEHGEGAQRRAHSHSPTTNLTRQVCLAAPLKTSNHKLLRVALQPWYLVITGLLMLRHLLRLLRLLMK